MDILGMLTGFTMVMAWTFWCIAHRWSVTRLVMGWFPVTVLAVLIVAAINSIA